MLPKKSQHQEYNNLYLCIRNPSITVQREKPTDKTIKHSMLPFLPRRNFARYEWTMKEFVFKNWPEEDLAPGADLIQANQGRSKKCK